MKFRREKKLLRKNMKRDISIGRMHTILMNLTSRTRESMSVSRDKYIKVNETTSMNLIEILQHLGRLIEIRMRTSPSEERERASNLACALVNGRKAQEEAGELQKMLEVMRMKHRTSVNEIEGKIEEERKLLEIIKLQNRKEINERIKKLDEQTKRIENATMIEKRQMEEVMIEANEIEYHSTCDYNLIREKELYATRKKVERHYLEILAKYDREVGELHRVMESLIKDTNSLSEKLKNLEETLALQEIQYVELKTERETAIKVSFLKNLTNFMRNRAAKIIQRTWRSYWERQQLRKKKKGKKKRQ